MSIKPLLIPLHTPLLPQAASELGGRLLRETVACPSVAVTTVSLSRSSSSAAGMGECQRAPTSETTNGQSTSFQSEVVAPLYTVLSKVCYSQPSPAHVIAAALFSHLMIWKSFLSMLLAKPDSLYAFRKWLFLWWMALTARATSTGETMMTSTSFFGGCYLLYAQQCSGCRQKKGKKSLLPLLSLRSNRCFDLGWPLNLSHAFFTLPPSEVIIICAVYFSDHIET